MHKLITSKYHSFCCYREYKSEIFISIFGALLRTKNNIQIILISRKVKETVVILTIHNNNYYLWISFIEAVYVSKIRPLSTCVPKCTLIIQSSKELFKKYNDNSGKLRLVELNTIQ